MSLLENIAKVGILILMFRFCYRIIKAMLKEFD